MRTRSLGGGADRYGTVAHLVSPRPRRVRRAGTATLALLLVVTMQVVVQLVATAAFALPAGATTSPPKGNSGRATDRPEPTTTRPAGPAASATPPTVPGAVGPAQRYADVPYPTAARVQPQTLTPVVAKAGTGYVEGRSRELPALRTARSTVFANPDGTRTLRMYEQDAFVPAGGKSARDDLAIGSHVRWVPVDPSLAVRGDGRWAPRAAGPVTLAGRGGDARLATLDLGAGVTSAIAVPGATDVTVDTSAGTARYPGIRPGTDLTLSATADGFTAQRVMSTAAAAQGLGYTLTLSGLTPRVDDATGAVVLRDGAGTVRATIPATSVVDSAVDPRSGDPSRTPARYSVTGKGDTWWIAIDADPGWVNDPSRVLPLTTGTSLRFNGDSDDTFVSTGNYRGQDNSTDGDLTVGTYNGGADRRASYLHFRPAFATLSNKYILGASLNLWNHWSYSCRARPVTVYRVTQPWAGSTTRTWPGPAYDAANPVASKSFAHGYSGCGAAWESLPISADRFTRWVHGVESFHGFALRASDNDSMAWKRFGSAQYSNATGRPFLDVLYSDYGASYSLPDLTFDPPVTGGSQGGITVRVTNWGSETWTPTNGYRLLYTLTQTDGTNSVGPHHFPMPTNVAPHQSVDIPIQVGPASPGSYLMTIDMTTPGGLWFGPSYGVPQATLTLSTVNGPPTISGNYPANNGAVDRLQPTLWANYVDPDNFPASADRGLLFELCGGTPEAPVDCRSSGWQQDAYWPVPAGALDWNRPAFWYVTVTDSQLTSPRIGPFWFTPRVTQPALTGSPGAAADQGEVPGLDPRTGNYSTSSTDASVAVPGPDLAVTRSYNSIDPRSDGAFGTGWSSSLDQRLSVDTDGTGNVVVRLGDGRSVRFGRRPDGSFSPPPGHNLTLVDIPATAQDPQTWRLRDATGALRVFDATGRILTVTDADNRAQVYSYGADGRLQRMTDLVSNRSLHLSWAGDRVETIATDAPAAGQPRPTWRYTYTDNQLSRVCSPLGADSCVDYSYADNVRYRSVVLDDQPTGYWPLGETSGSTAANIAAQEPGQYDATYQNVALGQPGAPAAGADRSVTLSGTPGSYVRLPDNLLNSSQGFTFEMWFKTTTRTPENNGVLLALQQYAPPTNQLQSRDLLRIHRDGRLAAEIPSAGGVTLGTYYTTNRVDDGQWHHTVYTGDIDGHRVYVDGVVIGSAGGPAKLNLDKRKVALVGTGWLLTVKSGPGRSHGYYPFGGEIDELAYYARPLGNTEVAEHWAARNSIRKLTGITEPGGFAAVSVGHDPLTGRVSTVTDRNGATWTLSSPAVTADGRRSVTLGSNARSSVAYTYDSRTGQLVGRTDTFGQRTWEYNSAGFVSRTVDENGLATGYATDARGNVLATTTCREATSCQTEYSGYFLNPDDPLDPRNDTVSWTADARSSSATDTTYRRTFGRDAAGRVLSVTHPAPVGASGAPTETYTYSVSGAPSADGGILPAGLLTSQTARNGGATTYSYNGRGDLTRTVDPVGLTTDVTYDDIGRQSSRTRSATVGGVRVDYGRVDYTYNETSQEKTVTGPAVTNLVTGVAHLPKVEHTYDPMGRRRTTTMSDTGGTATRTWSWTYDAAGRLTGSTEPVVGETRQDWDTLGNVVRMIRPDGIRVEYTYDERHLPVETVMVGTGVDPADQAATRFVTESRGYDAAGRLAFTLDGNGRQSDITYYDDNRMRSVVRVMRDAGGQPVGETTLRQWSYNAAGYVTSVYGQGIPRTSQSYDPDGNLAVSVVDPSGAARTATYTRNADGSIRRIARTAASTGTRAETLEYGYDAAGRITTSTIDNTGGTPAALVTRMTRDARGLVTEEIDPTGTATTYTYDTLDKLVAVTGAPRTVWVAGVRTDAVRPVTTIGRNGFGDAVDVRDPTGAASRATVDGLGRTTDVTLPTYTPPGGAPIAAVHRVAYNAAGQPVSYTDPRGKVSTTTYDPHGRASAVTGPDPDGSGPKQPATWRTVYNRSGEPVEQIDPTGGRRLTTWNDDGGVATTTDSDRVAGQTLYYTTVHHYNSLHLPTQVTSPLGHVTKLRYNGAGDLLRAIDPTNRFVEMTYDMAGRPLTVRNGVQQGSTDNYLRVMHAFRYDRAGRLTGEDDCTVSTVTFCLTPSRSTSTTYDGAGRVTRVRSAEGRVLTNSYDGAGQLASTTQLVDPANAASGISVSFGYDAAGRQTRRVDGNGNATDYTFTPWGLPESVIEPATSAHPAAADRTWSTVYDAAGRPVTQKLPGGVTRQRTFDDVGYLIRETGSGAESTTAERMLDYDDAGRLRSMSGPGGTTTYTWNDRNLLATATGAAGAAVHTYDSDGRLAGRTDAAGASTFTYDGAGRLQTATDPLTGLTNTYTYDAVTGQAASVRFGTGGPQRVFTYDNRYFRLTGDSLKRADGTTVSATTYGYDLDDLVTSKTTTGVAGAGANQYSYDGLSRLKSWTRPDGQVVGYGYDNASNRTTVTAAGVTRTSAFDQRNRLASVSGGSEPTETYQWTPRGTLASVSSPVGDSTFQFDAFERLTRVQKPDLTTTYAYDSIDRLATRNGVGVQYGDLTNNAVRTPTATDEALLFRLPTGEPVSTKTPGATTGEVVVADPTHGDGTATADPATGAVTSSATYDPWGERTAGTGRPPVGYQGGFSDDRTGLTNAHSRWYSSGDGVFASRDSVQPDVPPVAQTNNYLYANGNPVTFNDPDGTTCNRPAGECPDQGGGGGGPPSDSWCLAHYGEPCSVGGGGDLHCNQLASTGSSCYDDQLNDHPSSGGGSGSGGSNGGGGNGSGKKPGAGSGKPKGPPPVAGRKPIGSEPSQRPGSENIGGGGVTNPPPSAPDAVTDTCNVGCAQLVPPMRTPQMPGGPTELPCVPYSNGCWSPGKCIAWWCLMKGHWDELLDILRIVCKIFCILIMYIIGVIAAAFCSMFAIPYCATVVAIVLFVITFALCMFATPDPDWTDWVTCLVAGIFTVLPFKWGSKFQQFDKRIVDWMKKFKDWWDKRRGVTP